MRRDAAIPSGDYRTTPFLKEFRFDPSKYSLRRIVVTLTGNTATTDVSVCVAESGKTTLSDAELAIGQVYRNDALAAAADPAPEANVIGNPIQCDVRQGESLYFYAKTGDDGVSGKVRLFF